MVLAVSTTGGGLSGPGPLDSGRQDSAGHNAGPHIYHEPVLLSEVLQHLVVWLDGVYVDATLGEGGHAAAVLRVTSPGARLLGLDRDPRTLAIADQRLQDPRSKFTSVRASYASMIDAAESRGIESVDGVLMDLGISSRQLESPGYGLSFLTEEPLDMRFDPASMLTAHDVVNNYGEQDLVQVLREYGEEPRARQVARAIVRSRPIDNTAVLARLVSTTLGPGRRRRLHPATRTFQALRIEVNDELNVLREGLEAAVELLSPGGRLVVISYHSLEDRIVKNFLARAAASCVCPPGLPVCVCGHVPTMRNINRRVIRPSQEEVNVNPRSRSAKMRVSERRYTAQPRSNQDDESG